MKRRTDFATAVLIFVAALTLSACAPNYVPPSGLGSDATPLQSDVIGPIATLPPVAHVAPASLPPVAATPVVRVAPTPAPVATEVTNGFQFSVPIAVSSAPRGSTTQVALTVLAPFDVTNATVQLNLFGPTGTYPFSRDLTGLTLSAGKAQTLTFDIPVDGAWQPGIYAVNATVYSAGWSTIYAAATKITTIGVQ